MQVFVINLDRRYDRLSHITGQLDRLGIEFVRVSAVDGQRLCSADLEIFNSEADWPRPSNSEFACFMSHRKCWNELVQSDQEYAVILEDDVIISNSGAEFLSDYSWFSDDVDLLRLETGNIKANYKRGGISTKYGRKLRELRSFHFGTGAYFISKKLANELLEITSNYIPVPIDHFLFDPDINHCHGRKVYQLSPAICIQERFLNKDESLLHGDIEGRSVYVARMSNKPKISKVKKILREVKKGINKGIKFPFEKRFIVSYE